MTWNKICNYFIDLITKELFEIESRIKEKKYDTIQTFGILHIKRTYIQISVYQNI